MQSSTSGPLHCLHVEWQAMHVLVSVFKKNPSPHDVQLPGDNEHVLQFLLH